MSRRPQPQVCARRRFPAFHRSLAVGRTPRAPVLGLEALLPLQSVFAFVDHAFDLVLRVFDLLFDLASETIGLAFGFHVFVVGEASDGLFDPALHLVSLAAHRESPSFVFRYSTAPKPTSTHPTLARRLRGGTATGRWRGNGAAELGLSGSVSAEGLVRLFDGQHPATGERLGRSLRRDGVAAWDVTFSADKSVSLLWALGDPDTRQQVLAAFEAATSQALGYLESVASSTRGASRTPVLDDNGHPVLNEDGSPRFRVVTWPIPTSGYVAASFTEFTSRADDPQLHTHVVVANKVQGTDGVWRTVDGRLLYRFQLAAGYLHEAVLRQELTKRLGVRWQPVSNGMADIEGFTRPQIDAFSRRRLQLETWCQDHGLPDTAAVRQVAVLATRAPKQDHPLEDLEVEWWERAVEVGLTPEWLTQMMGASREVTPVDPTKLFEWLASPEGLTERASTFGRAEVVKEIAGALPNGSTRNQIEHLAETFLHTRDIVPLLPTHNAEQVEEPDSLIDVAPDRLDVLTKAEATGRLMRRQDGSLFPGISHERRYTTTELLVTEQRIIEQARAGIGAGRWDCTRSSRGGAAATPSASDRRAAGDGLPVRHLNQHHRHRDRPGRDRQNRGDGSDRPARHTDRYADCGWGAGR